MKNRYFFRQSFGFILAFLLAIGFGLNAAGAATVEYHLVIEKKPVTVAGETYEKPTINGGIPGPTLSFTEGDAVVIHVENRLNEDTSLHWHGLLLPSGMDGVPGQGGFAGIKPGETFTYRFTLRQNGTYWYHAHSMGQEQDGVYGALIIHPRTEAATKTKAKDTPAAEYDRDYAILLSDFHKDDSLKILANLKKSSDYYQNARRTLGDFNRDAEKMGLADAWKNALEWGEMRMLETDLSDVTGYHFLVNGRTPEDNWTGLFKKGEKIRLRVINASAMSFFDLRIAGLPMTIIAADGQNVEPVTIDEFRIAPAETYDVIVSPPEDKAYTIAAESMDRAGFALATLAPQEGMRGEAPLQRARARLTMADMGMEGMNMGGMDMEGMDHKGMNMHHHGHTGGESGWAVTGAPDGSRLLSYKDLRFLGIQPKNQKPEEEIILRLGGNMERYIWTLNGKKHGENEPIKLEKGERVRLTYINETMMAHPIHLHGMFVQLENGQPPEKMPNKHTVIVPPGQSVSVQLTADEPGEWSFHCHLLYHMLAGMMTELVVSEKNAPDTLPNTHAH